MNKTHPLRIWRKANNRSQSWLGSEVGVQASTISMIESGQRGASLELALRIAAATDRAVPIECLTRPSQVEAA